MAEDTEDEQSDEERINEEDDHDLCSILPCRSYIDSNQKFNFLAVAAVAYTYLQIEMLEAVYAWLVTLRVLPACMDVGFLCVSERVEGKFAQSDCI